MAVIGKEFAILAINSNAQFVIHNEEIEWQNGTTPIADADIDAKQEELQAEEDAKIQAHENLKASAKAKLIAGEALTEEEANTIVL
tara:strand:- start:1597 stop:1854 length:258 start_codon:yes stop_codon:yes gene_type:complete